MGRKREVLHVRLEPISAGRKPVEFDVSGMQSIRLQRGGTVFMSPIQGWRAHFHEDEATLIPDFADRKAEQLASIPTLSRRVEEAFTNVEAWLLPKRARVNVLPATSGDRFIYKRRVFPRMVIEVR